MPLSSFYNYSKGHSTCPFKSLHKLDFVSQHIFIKWVRLITSALTKLAKLRKYLDQSHPTWHRRGTEEQLDALYSSCKADNIEGVSHK